MQSKLQAIAAALWQIAEKTGKAGKHLDSELAVACYVKEHQPTTAHRPPKYLSGSPRSRHLPRGLRCPRHRRHQDLCRTQRLARLGIHLGAETIPLADTRRTIVTDYPTPTTPDLTSQTDLDRS